VISRRRDRVETIMARLCCPVALLLLIVAVLLWSEVLRRTLRGDFER